MLLRHIQLPFQLQLHQCRRLPRLLPSLCRPRHCLRRSSDTPPAATAPKIPLSRVAIDAVRASASIDELRMRVTAFRLSRSQYGHASFVNAALDRMDELRADGDLDLYNELLAVFPTENSYKTASLLDAIWPKPSVHVEAALRCLDRMEDRQIIPEASTYETVLRSFGRASAPVKKARAMAYWMRRYLFANPFALPDILPTEPTDRVLLYLRRMASHDVYLLNLNKLETDGASAAYSQSTSQAALLRKFVADKPASATFSVHGLYAVWMRKQMLSYAMLTASTRRGDASHDYILSTCMCLQADGQAPPADHEVWPLAVQSWLHDLEARVPELGAHAVGIHLASFEEEDADEDEDDGVSGQYDGVEAASVAEDGDRARK